MAERKTLQLLAVLAAAVVLAGATPSVPIDKALMAQRQLVAERPDNAGALNDLANLLVEMGETAEAEEAYRRAMQIEPDRPEPPFNLALLLAADKKPREARRMLKQMLERHPGHAWGHYQLGTLRQAHGTRRRALQSYREAFRLDPSLSDPRRNPHVLDNPLATAAMLEAFASIANEATTQRIYVEPSRITGLLLPTLAAEPMGGMAEEAETAAEPPEEEADELETEEVVDPDGPRG